MSVGLTRYTEMLAELGLTAFRWPGTTRYVRGEAPRLRWRVSADERERVLALPGIGAVVEPGLHEHMLGLPYDVDPELPPASIVLEPYPGDWR